jgi:hypothetical protein
MPVGIVMNVVRLVTMIGTVAATVYNVLALLSVGTRGAWAMAVVSVALPAALWGLALRRRDSKVADALMVSSISIAIALMFVIDFLVR